VGEQNIVWNTYMYVHGVWKKQTKRVRGFLEGQMGFDKVCIEIDLARSSVSVSRADFPEMER
jgi:hypothetical protein